MMLELALRLIADAAAVLAVWVLRAAAIIGTYWLFIVTVALGGPAAGTAVLLAAIATAAVATARNRRAAAADPYEVDGMVRIGPDWVGCVRCPWHARGATPLARHRAYLTHLQTEHEGEHHP